jgi:hypothetical protein
MLVRATPSPVSFVSEFVECSPSQCVDSTLVWGAVFQRLFVFIFASEAGLGSNWGPLGGVLVVVSRYRYKVV